MISYQQKLLAQKDLLALYASVKWTAYTADPEKLMRALQQSLLVISAWDNDTLVGLIRSVGDGETILYIQDLLVLPTYQNQGIGLQLMQQMLQAFPDVRQKVLLTDEASDVRHFYEKCGFQSADQGQTVAFYRYDH